MEHIPIKGGEVIKKGAKTCVYNVVIIPERGGKTAQLRLRHRSIQFIVIIVSVISLLSIVGSVVFFGKYKSTQEVSENLLKKTQTFQQSDREKDVYIRMLEEKNKRNQEKIKDYKEYEKTVEEKMKALGELKELEQEIREKLNNSILLKKGLSQNGSYNQLLVAAQFEGEVPNAMKYTQNMQGQVRELRELNQQLDRLLEKEQYIPTRLPAVGRITSYFSVRKNPFGGSQQMHKGLDIANSYATPIYATARGVVIFSGYQNGFGKVIKISHQNEIETLYAHNSKLLVKVGEEVKKDQQIALMGSTGLSTGVHVHFEVHKDGKPINPLKILE